jgi:hypothetical protein
VKKTPGICDRCGQRFLLSSLKPLVVKRKSTGLKVCKACWEPSHPQLEVGERKYDDPKAVKDPRSDSGELPAVRTYKDFDGNQVDSSVGVEFKVPRIW